jgi:hypothetical protein
MFDVNVIITGIIGICTTFIGSFSSYFFARKKYYSEVNTNEIENLKKSLSFYEDIVRDNNEKLQFYIKLAEANRIEVYRLKDIIHRLLNNSCLDSKCIKRKFYSEEQIKNILEDLTPNIEDK